MKLRLRNSKNQYVDLFADETKYQVASITGLDPGKAQINSSTIVGVDGTRFNSARLNNRNIVITMKINGDADTNRKNIYNKFPLKEKVRVFHGAGLAYDVYIDGYVDSISCNIFAQKEMMQLSILCDDPYFTDVSETYTNPNTSQGRAVFSCSNSGIIDVGFNLDLIMTGTFNSISVSGTSGEMQISYSFVNPWIIINTRDKTARLKENNGAVVNVDLIPYMSLSSEFFTIPVGSSTVEVDFPDSAECSEGGLGYYQKYGGI